MDMKAILSRQLIIRTHALRPFGQHVPLFRATRTPFPTCNVSNVSLPGGSNSTTALSSNACLFWQFVFSVSQAVHRN